MLKEPPHSEKSVRAFSLNPNSLVYTTTRIMKRETNVTDVHHDVDGDWQFLDAEGSLDVDDIAKVHLEHILDWHPEVADLGDLPRGWHAWRDEESGAWNLEPFEAPDEGEV